MDSQKTFGGNDHFGSERRVPATFVELISAILGVSIVLEYLCRQLVALVPGACCQVETPLPYLGADDFERQNRRNLMSSSVPAQVNHSVEQAPEWLAHGIERVCRW